MGINNVMQTGRSGMLASRANISTAGHNISNANTKGFSRQDVKQEAVDPGRAAGGRGQLGRGTLVTGVSRVNDEYLEKQLRDATREHSYFDEKNALIRHVEEIFNEMDGDGLNRVISRFFNEFRKLSNDPSNPAIRESVAESSRALVNDIHRMRRTLVETQKLIDSRVENYAIEVNSVTEEVKNLNLKIKSSEVGGSEANDLRDQRDLALKKLAGYLPIQTHKDENGGVNVDLKGGGALISGPVAQTLRVDRTPAGQNGKSEGSLSLRTSGSSNSDITDRMREGRFGALLGLRDESIQDIINDLDQLAFAMTRSVNQIHRQGVTQNGQTGISFFAELPDEARAAEFIQLSQEVRESANNIATAVDFNSPGDNRVALAISKLQGAMLLQNGKSNFDEFYNGMVGKIGVESAQTRSALAQQTSIMGQLEKMRDRISGVSLDEETANLIRYQQMFDASAKVIQIADEMLSTVLDLRR
jgi:flagellar hook-associated protein 1